MGELLGGRYRLGAPLGRGGMGTVYEAIQEGLGRRVAVKLLDLRLSEDREQLERFRREAEVVAALGHPNIVQVTDFQYPETQGAQPFLVMEHLRGESLGVRIDREQVMQAGTVAFVAAQVLSALAAAHRAGVVHRDIKPDNVFILSDAAVPDTVKVLDFGIAKLVTDGQQKLTGTGAMLGTPAFMAPEQARGEVDVDARADLYAVGAMMYQALSGNLPYNAPSVPALLFAIVEKAPEPLATLRPDLPLDLVAVIERAMAKNRKDRFPDADSMRQALAPWSGLPASIRPVVSAHADTVASGNIAMHDQATPIVVHRTPPPVSATAATTVAPPPSAATRKGMSALTLIALVIMVGIVATASVFIVAILAKNNTQAVSASPSTITITSTSPITSTIASTSPSAIASAPVVVKKKRYSGSTGWRSSGDFGGCAKCDWHAFGQDLDMKVPATSACFAASQYEPPIHEGPYYTLSTDDAGHITLISSLGGTPNLDKCLLKVMQEVGIKGGPGTFRVGFIGECTKGWSEKCD
jgi:serine/threonine-protein kinase